MPPCSPRSNRSRVTSSTNSGTPPVRSATPSTTSLGSACRAASSATMSRTCWRSSGASESCRGASACPRAAGTPAAGRDDEQWRQRAALGDAAQDIERGRIGPMQIFERQHHRLNARARHHPIGQRRQLPAPQFLGRQSRRAFRRQRNVEERREQSGILRRVELDLRQRILQVREPLLGRYIGAAEALAAPFGDRVQRRVLQKLRAAPFDPGVRHLAQPGMKFLDQARFTQPRLADDQSPIARHPAAPAPSAASAWRFPRRGRRAA